MVNPLYIIASFLIAAFASALTDKLSKKLTLGMVLITIAGVITATVYRIWLIQSNPALQSEYFTAGFSTPLSIGLSFGFNEAVMLLLVNVIGLLGGISFSRRFLADGAQPMALYLLLLLGAND
jgi:formate hydrogenlyase subunit 3/multisubunit Na+/H+ antiporter MnhD subunit